MDELMKHELAILRAENEGLTAFIWLVIGFGIFVFILVGVAIALGVN